MQQVWGRRRRRSTSCPPSDAPEARRIRMSRPGVRVRAGGAHAWSVGGVGAPTGLRRPAHARVWPRPRPRAASWGGSSPKAARNPVWAPTEKEGWGCPDAAASRSCSPAALAIAMGAPRGGHEATRATRGRPLQRTGLSEALSRSESPSQMGGAGSGRTARQTAAGTSIGPTLPARPIRRFGFCEVKRLVAAPFGVAGEVPTLAPAMRRVSGVFPRRNRRYHTKVCVDENGTQTELFLNCENFPAQTAFGYWPRGVYWCD